jgi:hypothetical protein
MTDLNKWMQVCVQIASRQLQRLSQVQRLLTSECQPFDEDSLGKEDACDTQKTQISKVHQD